MNVIGVCPLQCGHSPSAAAALSSPPRSHHGVSNAAAVLCSSRESSKASSSSSSSFPTRLLSLSTSLIGRGRSLAGSGCPSPSPGAQRESTVVSAGLLDFWGGDLLGFDLDKWSQDVEDYGSIAVYAPPEGGYEGRYATRLRQEGYHFMNISARGLGDPEAYLTKIHGVRPAHLGKQAIECFYLPPEVDHRLSALPEDCKGLVLWVIEAKVLSQTELQYLALLPALREKVKVIAECGSWRSYRWKPLREVSGLPIVESSDTEGSKVAGTAEASQVAETAEPPEVAETAEVPKESVPESLVEKEPAVKVPV